MKTNSIKKMAGTFGLLLLATGVSDAAYDANWKKSQCDSYSYHGLDERYVFGGSAGWRNNNQWDSDEGTDCSDYVPRCLALPSYVGEFTGSGHPYSTASLYPGIPNTVSVGSVGSMQEWDFWVWRDSGAGHTGLHRKYDANGNVLTREAKGTAYGVVADTRSKQSLIDQGSRYWRRKNWGTDAPAVSTAYGGELVGNFNGDGTNGVGRADYALFRPSNGTWHIKFHPTDITHSFTYGASGDQPRAGDFNGDGKDDQVVFRPADHMWYVRFSSDGSSHDFSFGRPGDIALLGGDFGSDKAEEAVLFRPSTGDWFVRFSQDASVHDFQFGANGDIPMIGDTIDSDKAPDAVLYRPSNHTWYVRFSTDGSVHSFSHGQSADIPRLADFSGDGVPDYALFRPSNGYWYVRFAHDGSVHSFQFGASGDIPLCGDFTGDGRIDQALFRPSNQRYYVRNAVNGGVSYITFGVSTDVPVR